MKILTKQNLSVNVNNKSITTRRPLIRAVVMLLFFYPDFIGIKDEIVELELSNSFV